MKSSFVDPGVLLGVAGLFRDIAEKSRANDEVAKRNQTFRNMLDELRFGANAEKTDAASAKDAAGASRKEDVSENKDASGKDEGEEVAFTKGDLEDLQALFGRTQLVNRLNQARFLLDTMRDHQMNLFRNRLMRSSSGFGLSSAFLFGEIGAQNTASLPFSLGSLASGLFGNAKFAAMTRFFGVF